MTVEDPDIKNTNNAILTNAYIEIDIAKGLRARANIGYSQNQYVSYNFTPAEPDQTRAIPLATLSQGQAESSSLLEEYTIIYNNTFAKIHSVNFTGGYSAQTFKSSNFGASRNGFDDPSEPFRNLSNGNSAYQFNYGSKGVKSGLASYFGRLNYGYKGRYLLTLTMRADGSSKFPVDKQWGYFPAFSAGWRISDEAFFKNNISLINNLKLTGGWGN